MPGCVDQPPTRSPTPVPHHVRASRPAPWAPEPVATRPETATLSVTPPPTADDAQRDAPIGKPPRPTRTMPGEAAIGSPQTTTDPQAQASGNRPATSPEHRSEIAPVPTDPPKSLHQVWQSDSRYNASYDPAKRQRMTAIVQGVETFVPADDAEPGLALRVNIDGVERVVHTGPLRYLRDQGVRFNYLDSLTIFASPATIAGNPVLLAQQISRGENTSITFRDSDSGAPLWNTSTAE